jgi:hypothetical protein
MRTYTSEEYQRAFHKQPEDVQDIICSLETDDKMCEVAKLCKLTDDQTGLYRTLMAQCLYGFISQDELPKHIKEELQLPEKKVQEIIQFSTAKFLKAVYVTLKNKSVSDTTTEQQNDILTEKTTPILQRIKSSQEHTDIIDVADITKIVATPKATNIFGTQSPLEQFLSKDTTLQSRFSKLPEKVRTSILSPEVALAFSTCVREHDLTKDGFVAFGNGVLHVLVGLQNTNDFRSEMRNKEVVPADKQTALVETVEKSIFKPVRDAIIQALAERNGKA